MFIKWKVVNIIYIKSVWKIWMIMKLDWNIYKNVNVMNLEIRIKVKIVILILLDFLIIWILFEIKKNIK